MKLRIRDKDHWHRLRAKNIGGSEVAALFGRSPYVTPWQLHMTKAGKLDIPFDETWTRAGKFFEAGVAKWASDKWGMKIRKVRDYYTDESAPGMGATLDYADSDGTPVEIKFTHYARDDWKFEGDVLLEIPESYVLQVQHQMACFGGDFAWVIAFVKGEPRRMKVRRSESLIAGIRSKVVEFWRAIDEDRPPPVDYKQDGDALSFLLFENSIRDIDVSEMEDVFAAYMQASAETKRSEERQKTLKTMIMERAEAEMRGSNEDSKKAVMRAGRYRMSLTRVEDSPGKLVTTDMVGERVGGRKGYLMSRFAENGDD